MHVGGGGHHCYNNNNNNNNNTLCLHSDSRITQYFCFRVFP